MHQALAPNTSVIDRKQHVRAFPSSASSLNLTGTRVCRIRLGGEDFVDPSSIRLQYRIENKINLWMKPYTGPWGAWGQVRLLSNGTELDNITNYGRFHQQYGWNHLKREEQFGAVGNEGMHVTATTANFKPAMGEINGSGFFTCMHRLHLSLLSAGKLLPLKYCPLD